MLARLTGGFGASRLRPKAATTFDAELLDGVADFVETERFFEHLKSQQQQKQQGDSDAPSSAAPASASAPPPHLSLAPRPPPTVASSPPAADAHVPSTSSSPSSSAVLVAPSADGGFVVVTREDAVEAMAFFIADCLSRSPEACGMDPKQLQRALGDAMSSLKRARWRAVLGWGRVAVAALSYGASVAFAAGGGPPPALYRAVVAALWAAARMAYRAVS
jgi:hypothetical protein